MYKITRFLRKFWLDERHFLSEYKDTAEVIYILY